MDSTVKQRMDQMADRFRVMSDPTRLQILAVIGDQELSVQEICQRTGFKQSNVSKHLRVLREIKAIACRQQSYYHYYRIVDPQISNCWHCTQNRCAIESLEVGSHESSISHISHGSDSSNVSDSELECSQPAD